MNTTSIARMDHAIPSLRQQAPLRGRRLLAMVALGCLAAGPLHAATYAGAEVLALAAKDVLGSPPTELTGALTHAGDAVQVIVGATPTLPDGQYRVDVATRAVVPLPPTLPLPDTRRTVSADGRFSVETIGSPRRVIIHDATTGIETLIPNDESTLDDVQPVISADGSTVAFGRNVPISVVPRVFDRRRNELATLTSIPTAGIAIDLSVSDDGRRVSYTHRPRFIFVDDPIGQWVLTRAGTTNSAPIARAHDLTVTTDPGQARATVTAAQVDAGSSDPDGDPLTLSLSPAGPYAPGTTQVTLTVSDGSLSSTATARITVVDAEAPAARVRIGLPIILRPTGELVDIQYAVTAHDNVALARLDLAVTQDEPVHGPRDPRPDAVVSIGSGGRPRLQLRAERSSGGDGRVYLVESTVVDTSGNRTTVFTPVVVPRRLTLGSILDVLGQAMAARRAATPLAYDSESFGFISFAN